MRSPIAAATSLSLPLWLMKISAIQDPGTTHAGRSGPAARWCCPDAYTLLRSQLSRKMRAVTDLTSAGQGLRSQDPRHSGAERDHHIEQSVGAVDAPQHEGDDAEHEGDDPGRPQQPIGRVGGERFGGGTYLLCARIRNEPSNAAASGARAGSAHAGAIAIASRGTGRSRINQ